MVPAQCQTDCMRCWLLSTMLRCPLRTIWLAETLIARGSAENIWLFSQSRECQRFLYHPQRPLDHAQTEGQCWVCPRFCLVWQHSHASPDPCIVTTAKSFPKTNGRFCAVYPVKAGENVCFIFKFLPVSPCTLCIQAVQ